MKNNCHHTVVVICSYHRWAHIRLNWKRGEWCHLGSSNPPVSHSTWHWTHWQHRCICCCTCRDNSIPCKGHTLLLVKAYMEEKNDWLLWATTVCWWIALPGFTGRLHQRATGLIHFWTWTFILYQKMKTKYSFWWRSLYWCCWWTVKLWVCYKVYFSCIPQSPLVALLQSIHTPASAQASA